MAYPLDMATDDFSPPPRTGLEPNGNVVVDSYRQDIMNGFEQAAPAYNSMNPGRPQSSVMVDLKDPIQIHLLTETALSDSKEFEILSQEEIDGLKKLVQTLTKRIESTRSNLLIQAKYRDAANSMTKLYNPSNGDDLDQDHSMREAEEERRVTQQRCEDLAAELFYLEKRLMEPKSRLLEHTAGILQLTHKASKKKATANGQPLNGVPGSPESLYTYTQGRDSLYGPDGFYTDDTSFEEFERGNAKALNNPLEIPMKSPIREQQSQLKEELDRSREENTYLMGSISDMEKRLEDLNSSLRDTIIRFNPEHNAEFLPLRDQPRRMDLIPPSFSGSSSTISKLRWKQLKQSSKLFWMSCMEMRMELRTLAAAMLRQL
uniref:Up-regulated during septation protein 1 domain-containing protein n=1 Tax=Bionectria ochroleuca TaxID=29856 RepID=A0A8H7NKY3_BIOOC